MSDHISKEMFDITIGRIRDRQWHILQKCPAGDYENKYEFVRGMTYAVNWLETEIANLAGKTESVEYVEPTAILTYEGSDLYRQVCAFQEGVNQLISTGYHLKGGPRVKYDAAAGKYTIVQEFGGKDERE